MKTSITFILALFLGLTSYSQTGLVLEFKQVENPNESTECYTIETVNASQNEIHLGAQNFRFYYNAASMRFIRDNVESALMGYGYGDVTVLQAVHNSNASGYGNLDFGENLGFVNFLIQDPGERRLGLKMIPNERVVCAKVCFEIDPENKNRNLVWARPELTSGYATAFTTISVMNETGVTAAEIISFEDIQQSGQQNSDNMVSTGKN